MSSRVVYFVHGTNVAVLALAITKEVKVPVIEIMRAVERKRLYEQRPGRHSYEEDISNA